MHHTSSGHPVSRSGAHGRVASGDNRRRVAAPRHTARGPLDAGVDDLLAEIPSTPSTPSRGLSPAPPRPLRGISPSSASSMSNPAGELPPKDFSHLVQAANFHPIPANTLPPPFLQQPRPSPDTPLAALLQAGQFRAAAASAAHVLASSTSAGDAGTIFSLLYVRLACLTILGLHLLAAQEAKCLGDLSSSFYRDPRTGVHLAPWELRVLAVRLQAFGFGDGRKGIMGYYELAREARAAIVGAAAADERRLWEARLRELGIRVADALVEIGELGEAARHLADLARSPGWGGAPTEPALSRELRAERAKIKTMEVLVWLRIGDVHAARRCLAQLRSAADDSESDDDVPLSPLSALVQMADCDFEGAAASWRALLEADGSNAMVAQNLAVCLLYIGRIDESMATLNALVNSNYAFHALLFNLSTLYELTSERARDRKMGLASRVASMPPSEIGWEKKGEDFKLL